MRASESGVVCFIGIGSNIGDSVLRCLEAMHRISAVGGVEFLRKSSLYVTEPVGVEEQHWFVNAVAEIRTVLTPSELLKVMQTIERVMGRVRKRKGGPRVIDLDILFYGQDILSEEDLVIPHPGLHERRFVLVPLSEIASYVIHPAYCVSIRGLLDRVGENKAVSFLSHEEEKRCFTLSAYS